MAVFNYDEHGSAYRDAYGRRGGALDEARRWVSMGGAVSSVALVLGLAYWGYALAVRDVSGVPVMRAAVGAMRVAPADPGGEQMLNQGLTVNAIAAMGTTAKPADTVTLAPLAEDLQPDDVPVAVASAAPQAASPVVVASALSDGTAQAPAVAAPPVEPATGLAQDTVDAAVAAALAEASADPNAISPALRPKPRPADLDGAVVEVAAPVVTQPAIAEKDPSTIPVGTILAQFGAYESADLARAKFAELVDNFGGLMAGKDMVVLKAETTGRIIYRLRASGLTSDADAKSFCAALQAEGTECVPVAQR